MLGDRAPFLMMIFRGVLPQSIFTVRAMHTALELILCTEDILSLSVMLAMLGRVMCAVVPRMELESFVPSGLKVQSTCFGEMWHVYKLHLLLPEYASTCSTFECMLRLKMGPINT